MRRGTETDAEAHRRGSDRLCPQQSEVRWELARPSGLEEAKLKQDFYEIRRWLQFKGPLCIRIAMEV